MAENIKMNGFQPKRTVLSIKTNEIPPSIQILLKDLKRVYNANENAKSLTGDAIGIVNASVTGQR